MGVVLYIMLSGKVPFPGRSEPEIIQNVIKGEFHFKHPAFENVSDQCKDLINKCLVKDFKLRYTATDALAHQWIIEKADEALTKGTIGGGVTSQVIEDIHDVLK